MTSLDETLPHDLVRAAAKHVIRNRDASVVGLMRRFRLGNPRARRVLQVLENHGVVGPQSGKLRREVLVERRHLQQVLGTLPGGDPS